MRPADAIRSVFRQYAGFSGRARRSEYWWFFLFNVVLGIVTSSIDRAAGNQIIGDLVSLALILPSLAVGARRMHDTGRSGWWVLINLIPIIGWIVFIVFACQDSQPGTNQYGPSPKGVAGGQYGSGDPTWPTPPQSGTW